LYATLQFIIPYHLYQYTAKSGQFVPESPGLTLFSGAGRVPCKELVFASLLVGCIRGRVDNMGRFTTGLLIGLVISLLFAPQAGEQTRRLLSETLQSIGNNTSSRQGAHHLPTAQELVAKATQQGMTVPEYEQQTESNNP
jgi:hypothetical protein